MIKYIFYILFGILFLLGFQYGTDKELQAVQLEKTAETAEPLSFTESSNCSDTFMSGQVHGNTHSYKNETSNFNLSDVLLTDISSFRSITFPTKTLKINATIIKQISNFLNAHLPENKWQGLSPETNYIKYSNRYYVYTLGHILI